MIDDALSKGVIAAAIEVHRYLGPGLLESAYEECICHELRLREVRFERQVPLRLVYKGAILPCGYRLDVLVEDAMVVEIKCVEAVLPIHVAQVLTYLKLTNLDVALIINFNVALIRDGLRRVTRKSGPPK